jgi:adenylate kinase
MRIFLLGLPGAGKGTQGEALSKILNVPHISLGDRARELAKNGEGQLADCIREVHKRSNWEPLSPDVAIALFYDSVPKQGGCIVDGFPRDRIQKDSISWDGFLNFFVHLKISEQESQRRVVDRDRAGDSLEKWKSRMEMERSRLPELLQNIGYRANWQELNHLVEVDAEQPQQDVTLAILKELARHGRISV